MGYDENHTLGSLLHHVEQYPQKKWVIEANGGWHLFIFTFLAVPLFVGAGLGLGIIKLIQLSGVERESLIGLPAILIMSCCVIVIAIALFWWYRRGVKQFGSQSIEAYDNGIRITGVRSSVQKGYTEISSVYFGVKSKIAKEILDVNSFINGKAGKSGSAMLNVRLTIEFTDGSKIRVTNCKIIFKKQSLRTWLETVKTICPGVFVR